MVRPKKCRNIYADPTVTYFKPRGIRLIELEEVCLELDQFEAVRLSDYEGLNQAEAAEKMGISQPTFHRLLDKAHRNIAKAIVEGKALRIELGGEKK